MQRPEIITATMPVDALLETMQTAQHSHPHIKGLDHLLGWHRSIRNGSTVIPQQDAVEIPHRISDLYDSNIVVFLDEFQNTCLPQHEFSIAGYLREAVESNTCPHFVTGSAMSILTREILGRGSLFGRFRSHPIKTLSEYWGVN